MAEIETDIYQERLIEREERLGEQMLPPPLILPLAAQTSGEEIKIEGRVGM